MTVINAQSRFPAREPDPWPAIRGTAGRDWHRQVRTKSLPWHPHTKDIVWGCIAVVGFLLIGSVHW